jgi:hypothetical protein
VAAGVVQLGPVVVDGRLEGVEGHVPVRLFAFAAGEVGQAGKMKKKQLI